MPLFDNFNCYKENIAFIFQNNKKMTYSELGKEVEKLGEHLKENTLLLIVAQISIEPIIGYIAALNKKTAIMFVDIKTSKPDVQKIINEYNPDFVFAPNDWFDNQDCLGRDSFFDYQKYKILKRTKLNPSQINSSLSILLPTSGSLGVSKFVRISHDNIESNTNSIICYLKITENDRAITTMPIGYSYMLSILNTHLHAGASIVICPHSILEKEFWHQAQLHQISSLSGVPVFFQMLIRLGLEKMSIPSLRQVTQAGGKLSDALTEKMINFCQSQKIEFITMYGQTEASPRISFLDWESAKTKIGSIGKAIPGVKIWLEFPNGDKINTPDTNGEIVVSGKNICLGYAESEDDLIRGDDNKGVLKTGDIGRQDSDGFYYITGRIKRIAKVNGLRMNLDDIEQKMKEVGLNIACIERDNKICVFFDDALEPRDVISMLHAQTGQKRTVFTCIHVSALPMTSNNKINYKKLTEM
jgi:long-chain acyl-CoA synthetase